ncbi:type I polyketide synthase [Streptomyces sp. NPDC001851]|uniref:type I polyketide synthase n=1 Tax=Streptomyces sp. NPDC001851 TaxID=3154529 RepID=UPI00332DDE91
MPWRSLRFRAHQLVPEPESAVRMHLPATAVGRIPDGMDFSAAATLPVVFLTVHHSLHQLARLAPGETVLVHGGAGGVGLAAAQYAEHTGARVIATAGTPAKRDLLRLLGIHHVLDSRSLDFAERVRALTEGRGVDVVLNSLAGEAIGRGLETLRPGGRFIELGKRDLYANSRLLLGPFLNNLTFCTTDLAQLAQDQPQVVTEQLAEVCRRIHEGVYRPVLHHVYPADRAADAFTALQHSRHVGKVVITLDDRPNDRRSPRTGSTRGKSSASSLRLDPHAAYLVTGGLSGFGAATARWLVDHGARHLHLVGRRGPATPYAQSLVAGLNAQGATVHVHAADAAVSEAMREVLGAADTPERPLRGVMHAAMVLDDAPLTQLSDDSVRRVVAAKAGAALVLDRLTRDRELDFFVLYSSASALLGNHRQANYTAANILLEALTRSRRDAGLPALAVAWGALADVGFVARHDLSEFMTQIGLPPMPPKDALAALEALLVAGDEASDGVVMAAGIDWGRVRHTIPALAAPRFRLVLSDTDHEDGSSHRELLQAVATASPEQAHVLVTEAVIDILSRVLQTSPDHIPADRPLEQLGLDSLMGAELMSAIHQRLGFSLPAVEIYNSPTVDDLARRCARRMSRAASPR